MYKEDVTKQHTSSKDGLSQKISESQPNKLSLFLSDSELSNKDRTENKIVEKDKFNAAMDSKKKDKEDITIVYTSTPQRSIRESNNQSNYSKKYSKNNSMMENVATENQVTKESVKNYSLDFDEKIRSLILKTKQVKRKLKILTSTVNCPTPEKHYKRTETYVRPLREALFRLSFSLKSVLKERSLQTEVKICDKSVNDEFSKPTQKQNPIEIECVNTTGSEGEVLCMNPEDEVFTHQFLGRNITDLSCHTDIKNVKTHKRKKCASTQKCTVNVDKARKNCFCDDDENPLSSNKIGCDFCQMWYHPHCVGLEDSNDIDKATNKRWFCPRCDKMCEGMFVTLTKCRTGKIQQEKNRSMTSGESNQSSKNSNIMELFDENKNLNFLKKTRKLKRRRKKSDVQMLEIEQSFDLECNHKSSDSDIKIMEKKCKNHYKKKFIPEENIFKQSCQIEGFITPDYQNSSKPDRWLIRKKIDRIPEKEINRISLTKYQIEKKSRKQLSQSCQIKIRKLSTKNNQSTKSMFICKQTVKVKNTDDF